MPPRPSPAWTAILLTGGTGSRLGGADKSTVDLGGSTPLEMVLTSLPADIAVIIVGPTTPTSRPVAFCREDPPGSGPAAAIAAAMPLVSTTAVGVIAVDMPWAAPVLGSAVKALGTHPDADVLLPLDADGRRQLLCSAWRTAALRESVAAAGDLLGRPVHHLLAGLDVCELDLPRTHTEHLSDIDTPEDLERERQRFADRRLAARANGEKAPD